MNNRHRIRRALAPLALLLAFASTSFAEAKKARVFDARYDAVWTAAMDAAKDGFLPDPSFSQQGRLRFRAGPMRGYRFEVVVKDVGDGKTKVDVQLRTTIYKLEKDAWRNADRYLMLVSRKLQERDRK